jgi:hypothetical protein
MLDRVEAETVNILAGKHATNVCFQESHFGPGMAELKR